jgi:hypothetical protein
MEPTFFINHRFCKHFIFVISQHYIVSAAAYFAVSGDFYFHARQRKSHGSGFSSVFISATYRNHRRGFR